MKICLTLFLVAGALLVGATPSQVGASSTNHQPMGIVPHGGSHAAAATGLTTAASTPLIYHGGDVMRTNTVYAIFWTPSGSTCDAGGGYTCAEYESAIDQYFTDVAAASGTSTNVYSVATQYYDNSGPIAYNATFGGSYVDQSSFPASQCTDSYHGAQDATCLTDQQLTTEITNAISANGWPADTSSSGPRHLYFIFTPSDVGVCDGPGSPSSGAQCSTNVFCAYHDYFLASGSAQIAYAVEPDNATIPGSGCTAAGPQPAGYGADPTINTISHEHNEAITDPWPNSGWLDINGDENGDKCAWTYMSNQTINGHSYYLQEEYSNANSACEPSYTPSSGPSVPTSTSPPVVSGVAGVGKTLTTSNGGWTGSPTSYAYQWQSCSASGTSCADISGATAATYKLAAGDAGHEIRSEVSAHNAGGSAGYVASTPTEAVVPAPANTAAPVVSGVAAVGRTLSTTQGSWNTPATYAYQWLRCSSAGTACSSIAHATSSTYVVARADRGHELEARVSATNAAATTTALSGPTAAVIGLPAASRLPAISGSAKVGKRLTVNAGLWSDSPSSFRYQWLRCGKGGGSCVRIKGATKSTYRLTKRDAHHRLRVRVTAVNAAGTARTISGTTRTVKS